MEFKNCRFVKNYFSQFFKKSKKTNKVSSIINANWKGDRDFFVYWEDFQLHVLKASTNTVVYSLHTVFIPEIIVISNGYIVSVVSLEKERISLVTLL
jgi:hypothetical protein